MSDKPSMPVSGLPDDTLSDTPKREHFATILEQYAKMMRAGELRQFAIIAIKQERQECTASICADNEGFGIFIGALAGVMQCNCHDPQCDVMAFKSLVGQIANAFNTGTLFAMPPPPEPGQSGKPN